MKKIFITGGHFASAKAVIQELIARGGYEIFYIGRKYSMESDNALALEFTEIPKLSGVHFLTITTGRVQRQFFVNAIQSIASLLKIGVGLIQAPFWLLKFQPKVVLSFGGYVAVPIVVWAWLFRIPIITHEQTTVYGRSNKLIANLSKKILVSWPESLPNFPKNKTVLTVTPVRQERIERRRDKGAGDIKNKPLIYVTGGSQGAHAINQVIFESLPNLLEKYQIIHQTGGSGLFKDFEKLSKRQSKNYQVFRSIDGKTSAEILSRADLIISRSGANICSEIIVLSKKAILIPLPNSFGHEQDKNAKIVTDLRLAKVIPQNLLTPKVLINEINSMVTSGNIAPTLADKYLKNLFVQASGKIVDQVEKES